MERALLEEIRQAMAALSGQPNVTYLGPSEAKRIAERFGTPTRLGSCNYASTVKNLSTALTVYLGTSRVKAGAHTQKKKDIRKAAPGTVRSVHDYLRRTPLARLDCTLGDRSGFTPGCALYLSTYRKESIRLAHMVAQTLFPARSAAQPGMTVVLVPEWQEKERQVLVFPEIGVTYILGTDYYGEAKNAYLRMAMWQAKQQGMLGLHAGTKVLRARGGDGSLRRVGMIMFGIAATGKTTHSCHDHGLDIPGEGVEIVQDDVVFWRGDGSAIGSERASYIKTEALTSEDQPLLYAAALRESAILENVMVDYLGDPHFGDRTLTANGHALIQRSDLGEHASETVNLPPIDELDGLVMAFMVRSYTVVPIASRLSPEQAALAFMLSESIDAAGSDQQAPAAGGIGSSPFIIGDAAEDCNMFYNLLKTHSDRIECYMLNTGGVGEIVEHHLDGARRVRQKVTRIQIPEMASVIRGIARGTAKWREDPDWMVDSLEHVDGLDISRFGLRNHYDQDRIDLLIANTRLERAAYAEQFAGLDPAISQAADL